MNKSTKANLSSSDLLSYITSTSIGHGSWKGSTHGFIFHWQNQLHLYESLIDPKEHFSDHLNTPDYKTPCTPLMNYVLSGIKLISTRPRLAYCLHTSSMLHCCSLLPFHMMPLSSDVLPLIVLSTDMSYRTASPTWM
jgi:hypothetical protein